MKISTLSIPALAISVALFGRTADAAIVQPLSATASSSIGSGGRTITTTIDGSGLSSGGLSGDILTETHTNNDINNAIYWLSASTGGNVSGEILTFTLSSATDIDGVHMWGYDRLGSTARSIQNFDLEFSTNGGVSYDTVIDAATLGNFIQPPTDPIGVQSKSFATVSGVTHIRITNITNFGDANYVGLSEIRFNSIPEPSAFLLSGLGGLLLLRRRR